MTKVHVEARKFAAEGYTIVLVGHDGHEEVEGTTGEAPDSIVLVETEEDVERSRSRTPTASPSSPRRRSRWTRPPRSSPRAKLPRSSRPKTDDICYATTNRQMAVKELARECDLVLVIGSTNSSNSNRLVEVAREHGAASHLIDNHPQVQEEWLEESRRSASPPAPAPPRSWSSAGRVLPRARGRGRLRAEDRRGGRALHAADGDPAPALRPRRLRHRAPGRRLAIPQPRTGAGAARLRRAPARTGSSESPPPVETGSRWCRPGAPPEREQPGVVDEERIGVPVVDGVTSSRSLALGSRVGAAGLEGELDRVPPDGSPGPLGGASSPGRRLGALGAPRPSLPAASAPVRRAGASGPSQPPRRRLADLLDDRGFGGPVLALAEVVPAQHAAAPPEEQRGPALAAVVAQTRPSASTPRAADPEPPHRGLDRLTERANPGPRGVDPEHLQAGLRRSADARRARRRGPARC